MNWFVDLAVLGRPEALIVPAQGFPLEPGSSGTGPTRARCRAGILPVVPGGSNGGGDSTSDCQKNVNEPATLSKGRATT